MTEVFEALMPECLGYGMRFDEFYSLDHGEIGMFLKGNRDRERRERLYELSASVRSAMALGDKILLGLNGKPYDKVREAFPELFEEKRGNRKQTWQEQEAIFRKFLRLP